MPAWSISLTERRISWGWYKELESERVRELESERVRELESERMRELERERFRVIMHE